MPHGHTPLDVIVDLGAGGPVALEGEGGAVRGAWALPEWAADLAEEKKVPEMIATFHLLFVKA